jgi:hypothetical protein
MDPISKQKILENNKKLKLNNLVEKAGFAHSAEFIVSKIIFL